MVIKELISLVAAGWRRRTDFLGRQDRSVIANFNTRTTEPIKITGTIIFNFELTLWKR